MEVLFVVTKSVDRVQVAEDAVSRLRSALAECGVVLPSLRVDALTAASDDPCPLVELGRPNVGTARRLATLLHEARR